MITQPNPATETQTPRVAPVASDQAAPDHLKRSLSARHLTMIAIGGAIGTGLFVASGASIAKAGPGGALLSYLIVGVMVYFLMTSLGELAAFMPESGSFATYGAKYVDQGFGFALGWNYWYNWAVTVAVDLTVAQVIMKYWLPQPWDSAAQWHTWWHSLTSAPSLVLLSDAVIHLPGWGWSVLFIGVIFLLNYVSVRGFGESEYWFALIKVVTVVFFIGIGLLMIFGVMHGGEQSGWKNLTMGEAPFKGGIPAMLGVAMLVGFSFQGTELIGIAAGESENPRQNIPKAVKQVFWRILIFYVLAVLIISVIIPYNDPNLLQKGEEHIALSPFTLIFSRAGLGIAAGLMNAVILTAVLSAGNSGMYASTRMLYALARDGKAPRIFARLSKNGTPHYALFATLAICMLCFLSSIFSAETVFFWLVGMSGMTGFIAWLGIAISHYRFRKGYVKQGGDLSKLPYQSKFFPFGPIFAFVLCLIIMIGQGYPLLIDEGLGTQGVSLAQAFSNVKWMDMIGAYVGIPLFLLIWLGYRIVKGGRIIPYEKMDFSQKEKF